MTCPPPRLVGFISWSSAGGSVWDGCGTFRSRSMAEGSGTLGTGLCFQFARLADCRRCDQLPHPSAALKDCVPSPALSQNEPASPPSRCTLFRMYECFARMRVCAPQAGLEPKGVVGVHVGAGNRTLVPCKNNKCS